MRSGNPTPSLLLRNRFLPYDPPPYAILRGDILTFGRATRTCPNKDWVSPPFKSRKPQISDFGYYSDTSSDAAVRLDRVICIAVLGTLYCTRITEIRDIRPRGVRVALCRCTLIPESLFSYPSIRQRVLRSSNSAVASRDLRSVVTVYAIPEFPFSDLVHDLSTNVLGMPAQRSDARDRSSLAGMIPWRTVECAVK